MEFKYIILEQLLLENRIQQVMDKFQSRRGRNLVSKAATSDPSDNQKYLSWIVKQLTGNKDDSEYLVSKNYNWKNRLFNKVMEAVSYFHQNQTRFQQKDINQYRHYDELIEACEELKETLSQKEARSKAKKGAKKIYEDGNIFVVMPKTHEASCYYGAGSRWCTTQKDDEQYFQQYSEDGYLFYFIVKHPVAGDKKFYKMAMNLAVSTEFLEMLEDLDYYEDEFDDYDTAEEFLDDYGCQGGECINEDCFDAPDRQYSSMEQFQRSDNKNSDEVKNSFRKAREVINKEYKPRLIEFTSELKEHAVEEINKYKYGDMDTRMTRMHTQIMSIAKKAGVENPEKMSFAELMEIVTTYLKDNKGNTNVDVEYGGFGRRNPLGDR